MQSSMNGGQPKFMVQQHCPQLAPEMELHWDGLPHHGAQADGGRLPAQPLQASLPLAVTAWMVEAAEPLLMKA